MVRQRIYVYVLCCFKNYQDKSLIEYKRERAVYLHAARIAHIVPQTPRPIKKHLALMLASETMIHFSTTTFVKDKERDTRQIREEEIR